MGQLRKGGSFAALDAEGRRFRIVNWIEYVDLTDGEPGQPRWEPSGFECLRLDDGRAVSALDGARYEIAGSGLLLDRVADASGTPRAHTPSVEPERSGRVWSPGIMRAVDHELEPSAQEPDPASDEGLMATFGIRRSGRFYLCRGYRYTRLRDAVAYARQAIERPELAREEPRRERSPGAGGAADSDVPRAQDVLLMALLRITFADGQYVFEGLRYDRLQDAVAYARLQQSATAT